MRPKSYRPERFSLHRFGRRILSWQVRHPKRALLLMAVITLALGWRLPSLSVRTSIYDLVIEDLPVTKQYREFQKIFGSDDLIRIVIKGRDVFSPDFFNLVEKLSADAAAIKGVRRVISISGVKKDVDPRNQWSLEKFAGICSSIELFTKNLLSEDRNTTAVTLVLNEDAEIKAVVENVEKLLRETRNELQRYQIGIPLVSQAMTDYTQGDLLTLLPLTVLTIAALLYFLYRNIWYTLFPLVSVSLSLVWTFGIMAWTRVPFSMLTMIVPVFIVAVGTAYCTHICASLIENVQKAETSQTAIVETFMVMSLPTGLAVLTDLIGFGSLLIMRITAIQEFAIFAGIGMLLLLFIFLTLLPAVFALIPLAQLRIKVTHAVSRVYIDRFLHFVIHLVSKKQKYIFAGTGILLLICTSGIFFVQVETNPVAYFRESTPVSRHFHDIYKSLSGSFPIHVVMEGPGEDYFESPEHLTRIIELQKYLETLPKVDKTVSFADYLKLVNYAVNKYDPKFYALPEETFEVRMLINNYKMILGQDMLTPFLDETYSKANILMLTHLASSREFLSVRERIHAYTREHFPEFRSFQVTGIGTVIAESSDQLAKGQINSLFSTMALIFAMMFVLFLSAKVGFVAILINTFPILITFGVMGWFGIELNMGTGLIASIAIGLAVDDIIHYLTRYNREFKKDLDKDRALRDCIISVGKPMVFFTLTISLGFSLLMFSHFIPTAVFGSLMVITIISALVGDLILLPALMLHVELVTAWDLLRLMPSLNGMSAGVVHELNQPLNAIKMGSEFLKILLQQGGEIPREDLAQVVNEVGAQVDRASEIIHRLQVFGEKPHFTKEAVDINRPIQDTAAILKHQLALDDIELVLELGEHLPMISGHHHRLGQVFYNLIVNAGEAIADCKKETLGIRHVIRIRSYEHRNRVKVAVSDTGIGIPTHLRERVFEPFFTTRETGKGKGLGLSIADQIVRDYGGRIEIESANETGTTVVLTFPAREE
ncbi:MAG: MMPL family transporter [Thermodesulfobacteriota bacterium]